jgi:protein-tyrosine phosphatase
MEVQVYWVPSPWPGRLGIVPRPAGGDWLADEMRSWQAAGLDIVVSLLTPDEIAELGLKEEEVCCHVAGLDFHTFPIVDRGVPESRTEVNKLIGKLRIALESGKNVGIHCRHGIGRSSMLVAAVLVSTGREPEEAFRRVTEARGRPVPDTPEQEAWVSQMKLEGVAAWIHLGEGNRDA